MDVKEAVRTAINYVKEVFADETLSNLGLEEIEYVPERKEWLVTVGFSRPWDFLPGLQLAGPGKRDYKIVHIDDMNGRVTAIKNRFVPELVGA